MGHYTFGSDVMRIDTRSDDIVIEEINRSIPDFIAVPVMEHMEQARYRFDCMRLDDQLAIEQKCYRLITVWTDSIDSTAMANDHGYAHPKFSPSEIAFIKDIQCHPTVAWAIDNSFDGLYVLRSEDASLTSTRFRFSVYMKEEHVTFWKLKYNGI